MATPLAEDSSIGDRAKVIRFLTDNCRNAVGCAYLEDQPQSDCTICADPPVACFGCARKRGGQPSSYAICHWRVSHPCPNR